MVKVSVDSKEVAKKYFEIYVNATNKSGKTVWKIDLGKIPYGTGVYNLGGEQGSKYFYLCKYEEFQAIDIQTGKVVWSVKEELNAATIIEAGDKLVVREGMAVDNIVIFDIKTGKKLKVMDYIQDKYLLKDTSRGFEEYYNLAPSTMKYKNGEVTIDVRDTDDNGHDSGKVGYLRINLSTYKIEFIK